MAGGILGGVFGLCSIWNNTMSPALLSFALSPYIAAQELGAAGAAKSLWIALGCRILIGVVAGWLWIGLKRLKVNDLIALPVVGVAGAMTNTVLVMGSIYVLLRPEYAALKNVAMEAVLGLVIGGVFMTASMMLWNYLVTPHLSGDPRETIAAMLLPVFLPFNLTKGLMNGALTMLLYKPVVVALRKAHLGS